MNLNLRSAEKYCSEDLSLIENFEAAFVSEDKWVIHHRLETHTSGGERRLVALSVEELKALDMYYNRPASELIFMRRSDHVKLHNEFYTEEIRRKVSKTLKGKPHSEEHKKRISEAMKGKIKRPFSEEARRKMSEAAKKRWAKKNT